MYIYVLVYVYVCMYVKSLDMEHSPLNHYEHLSFLFPMVLEIFTY